MARAYMRFGMTISEEVARAFGGSNAVAEIIDEIVDLTGATTPDITQVYGDVLALSGGALTLNLGALPQVALDNTTTDWDTLIVHAFYIKNLGANAMTFKSGAVNGYPLFTATDGTIVPASARLMGYAPSGYGTLASASSEQIDITGTAAQTFQIVLAAGSSV